MKKKITIFVPVVILFILVLTVFGCKKKPTEPEYPNGIEVTEETKVIDPEQTTINQVTPDQVIISGSTNLNRGDIIVSEVSAVAPSGFLRKVQSVTVQGNQTILNTSSANLEDVFYKADISVNQALRTRDINESRMLSSGVLFIPDAKNDERFSYVINKQIALPTGQFLNINGELQAGNSFDFDLKIREKKISYVKYTHIAEQSSELAVSVNNSFNYSEDFDLYEHTFNPFTVWIGPVPLVFVPKIKVVLNVSANGISGVSTSVTQTASMSAGLQMQDGQWSNFCDKDVSFEYQAPQLDNEATLSIGAGPEFNLMLFGVAGPYMDARGSHVLNTDIMNTPWWTLSGKLKIDGGILFDVLGFQSDYSTNLLNYSYIIAQAGQNQVARPSFSPPGGSYSTDQSVSITCATPNATIRYTSNGTTPSSSSPVYSNPISVSLNTTLKARAFKAGWDDSEIASANYVIASSPTETIYVSGGTFNNGTSDVTLSSFYIAKYETTQAEYQAVMGTNPSSAYGVGANYPVHYVSWFNAIEYCNRRSVMEGLTPCYSYGSDGTNPSNWPSGWNSRNGNHTNVSCDWSANGYRLPTEMEWMYAAKGGNQSQGYTYAGSNDINAVAWYAGNNSPYCTKPVGTKLPNELGIYDMSGNVREWNWDIYNTSYPSGAQTNPHGATSGLFRVFRGGSWNVVANGCTVSFRNGIDATYSSFNIGFRCVRVSP